MMLGIPIPETGAADCSAYVKDQGPAFSRWQSLRPTAEAEIIARKGWYDYTDFAPYGFQEVGHRATAEELQRMGACCKPRFDDLMTGSPTYSASLLDGEVIEERIYCHSEMGMGGLALVPVLAVGAVLLLLMLSKGNG